MLPVCRLHRHALCQLRDCPEAIGLDAVLLLLGEGGCLLGLAAMHCSLLAQRELTWKLGAIRVRQCENEALSLQALVDVLDVVEVPLAPGRARTAPGMISNSSQTS